MFLVSVAFCFLNADSLQNHNVHRASSLYFENALKTVRDALMNSRKAAEFYRKKEYSKSIAYFDKSEKQILSLKIPTLRRGDVLATIYLGLANSYRQLNRFNEAEKYFKKAIRHAENAPSDKRERMLTIYSEYATFLAHDLFEYQRAEKYFDKIIGLVTSKSKKVPPGSRVVVLLNLSSTLDKLDMTEKSLKLCLDAKRIVERHPNIDIKFKIRTYEYLSDEYFRMGDYSQAFKYMNNSLELAKSRYGPKSLIALDMELKKASLFRKMGMYEESRKVLSALLPYERIMPWQMYYDLHNGLGIVLKHLKKYEEAKKHYGKAAEVWARYTRMPDPAMENNLALLYKDQNRTGEALEHLLKAIKIRQQRQFGNKERNTALASNYMNLGSLYDDMGRYVEAEKYYKKALAIRQKVYGPQSEPVASVLSNMAVLYHHAGNLQKAYRYAAKSFKGYMKYSGKILPNLDRATSRNFLKANRRYLDHFMEYGFDAYIQDKKNDAGKIKEEIYEGWLDYKGSQFDNLNITLALLLSSTNEKVNTLLKSLLADERELARLYQNYPKPDRRKLWKEAIKKTKNEIADLKRKISKILDRQDFAGKLSTLSYRDISSILKKNELYIDYARTDGNYYLFALDRQGHITFKKLDRNTTERIDRLVRDFRHNVNTFVSDGNITADRLQSLTIQAKKKLSRLYRLALSDPLSTVLADKSDLIISPDGALRLIPFEAFYDITKGKYLIESKKIRYVPNGKEFVRLSKYVYRTHNNKSVVIAAPDFDVDVATRYPQTEQKSVEGKEGADYLSRSGIVRSLFRMRFNPLPGTRAEAKAIETIFGKDHVREYKEINATESNLFRVKRPEILHIATHGFFINDKNIPNPMLKSGIALTGANASAVRGRSDGIVTALKLSGLDLRGTDLVVLSACNTGVVDPKSTESVSGLAKAFIQAGAKDIVMSLWPVNDQSTKELMTSFYRQMHQQGAYAEALRAAKLKMIRQNMHPYFWAPFILSGQ